MYKITKIDYKKDSCDIYINDELFLNVDIMVLDEIRLRKHDIITQEKLDELEILNNKIQAKNRAYKIITRSAVTEKMLRFKLKQKYGFEDDAIEYAMSKIKQYNYLDDRAFAKGYINSHSNKSKKELECQLLSKGVASHIVDELLAGYKDDLENVLNIARRSANSLDLNDKNDYQKVKGKLYRRGFNKEMIEQALILLKEEYNG